MRFTSSAGTFPITSMDDPKSKAEIAPVEIPDEMLDRIRAIRERLDRLRIKRPGYQITDRTHRLTILDEGDDDSHVAHLAPRY